MYIRGLYDSGIILSDKADQIKWSWNTQNGQVNSKLEYEGISFLHMDVEKKWWYKYLWKWN